MAVQIQVDDKWLTARDYQASAPTNGVTALPHAYLLRASWACKAAAFEDLGDDDRYDYDDEGPVATWQKRAAYN